MKHSHGITSRTSIAGWITRLASGATLARLVAVVGVALLVTAARPAVAAAEPTSAGVSTYAPGPPEEIVWVMEIISGRDIDGDGIIGPPPGTP